MENFEPENVIRYDRWISWQDGDGVSQCVKASDYDKLLALYRALQPQMTLAEKYGTVEIK